MSNPAMLHCVSLPTYYHGSAHPLTSLKENRRDDDGFALYLSASVNVARRYGPHVSRFTLLPATLCCLSIGQWCNPEANEVEADLVLVRGDAESYDFYADMLAVRNTSLLRFESLVTPAEMELLDDGRAFLQEPSGPASRDWDVWVADQYSGSLREALEDVDWTIEADNHMQLQLPDLAGHPSWAVTVRQQSGSEDWLAVSTTGQSGRGTREQMLVQADLWSRTERRRREDSVRPGLAPALACAA